MVFFLSFGLFCFLQFSACGSTSEADARIIEEIQKHRSGKDFSFKKNPASPIPQEQKSEFPGLHYFPVDLSYRFEATLQKYPNPGVIKMVTSQGVEREALKYGFFEFEMEHRPCILQVYKLLDVWESHPDYLFIPFLDQTTGTDSYPGGRYLDLKETNKANYVLDFNLAFNPSCAYGKQGYNCPLPPRENLMDISVRAGEKKYLLADH